MATARVATTIHDEGASQAVVAHAVGFSAETDIHDTFCKVAFAFITLMQPFLINVGVTTPGASQHLLQQMEMDMEMYTDDLTALMFLLTAWGEKPQAG